MTVTLDIGMGLLILAFLLFVSNCFIVILAFWGPKKPNKNVPVYFDKDGKMHIDELERRDDLR